LARPYIWRFSVFRGLIWPSAWPFDQSSSVGATIAALSARRPHERGHQAPFCLLQPGVQVVGLSVPDHLLDVVDQHSRFGEPRHVIFDLCECDCLVP